MLPRSSLAEEEPNTHFTASAIFDLPQPLGPTIALNLSLNLIIVGSTNDLNPASLICFNINLTFFSLFNEVFHESSIMFSFYKNLIMTTQLLGSQPTAQPTKELETFENPNIERDSHIHMQIPEFTCLCPKTGQPDFATLYLDYIPEKRCVELKSLKLYIWSFRDEGCFHEAVTNRILDDLVKATNPRFMRLTAKFFVRGGIFTNVTVEHMKKGWKAEPYIDLNQFSTEKNFRD